MRLRSLLLDWIIALVPLSRREWLEALFAERQAMASTFENALWTLGALKLVGWTVLTEVRHHPRYLLEEAFMKTIVATLSAVNVVAAFGLGGVFVATNDVPWIVLAISAGLLAQGGYTLLHLTGALERYQPYARHLLLSGQSLALMIGLLGAVSSMTYNVNPPNGDNEYGPLTVAILILTLAAATLFAETVAPRQDSPSIA